MRVVLADPVGSALAGWLETGRLGPDGACAVKGIGASEPPAILDRSVIDAAERVSDEESFAVVRRLVREIEAAGRRSCTQSDPWYLFLGEKIAARTTNVRRAHGRSKSP